MKDDDDELEEDSFDDDELDSTNGSNGDKVEVAANVESLETASEEPVVAGSSPLFSDQQQSSDQEQGESKSFE